MKTFLQLNSYVAIASCILATSVSFPANAYASVSMKADSAAETPEPYCLVEAKPENNSTVEKLDVIMTQWEGTETDFGIDVSNDTQAATLTDAEGNEVAYGRLRNVPSGIQITLSETITAPGEYTLTIKPDMVYAIGDFNEETFEFIKLEGSGNELTELNYTVMAAVESMTLTEANPEDNSTVEKLDVIMTQWEGTETDFGIDVSNDTQAATLTDAEGNEVAYGRLRNVPSGIQITLSETITAPGEYTLTIKPDMVYAIGDFNEETFEFIKLEGSGNELTELHYTVMASVEPMTLTEANPEDNSTVEKLDVIMTQWEGTETDFGIDVSNDTQAATLTDAEGNEVAYGRLRNVPSGIQITLSETITAPGEYTLTIKPEMVYAIGDFNEETFEFIKLEGSGNELTELHYTVMAAVEPMTLTEANPEDNSTVEKLDVIMTQWEGTETDFGIDVSNDTQAATLTDAEGNVVTYGRLRNVPSGIQITLNDAVTEQGKYTLTIKPDMVYAIGDFNEETFEFIKLEGSGNELTELHYEVSGLNGVADIMSEGESIIYSDGIIQVNGMNNPEISVCTMNGNVVSDKNLTAGIYIVKASENGRSIVSKIVVR